MPISKYDEEAPLRLEIGRDIDKIFNKQKKDKNLYEDKIIKRYERLKDLEPSSPVKASFRRMQKKQERIEDKGVTMRRRKAAKEREAAIKKQIKKEEHKLRSIEYKREARKATEPLRKSILRQQALERELEEETGNEEKQQEDYDSDHAYSLEEASTASPLESSSKYSGTGLRSKNGRSKIKKRFVSRKGLKRRKKK